MARKQFSVKTKQRVLDYISQNSSSRSDIARALRLTPNTVGAVVAAQRDKYGADAIVTDPNTLSYVVPTVDNADVVDAWEKNRRKHVRTSMARTVITMRNYQESIAARDPQTARALDLAIKATIFAADVLNY